jgi:flap endonuclease-1
MGIKHLNQFLRKECSEAIKVMALNELSGRTVVVDASIFMYRFIADDALLENMYSMLSFFKMHDIVALFIFDGKPPEEKRKTLHKRSRLKRIAELQYNRLLDDNSNNSNNNNNSNNSNNINNNNAAALKALRRRFIRVSDADFDRVKTLMRAFGVQYIVAGGEADALCAQMVIKRKAYACVSDDTDLFVYGCCRVLRHINLFDQTVTMYDMHKMLHILGITMTEFRQICVISGTDYLRGLKLKIAIGLFKHYKKCGQDAEERGDVFAPDFYTWLHHTQGDRFDYDNTMTVYNMFETMPTHLASTIVPANTKRNDVLLHEVMAHENFIFVA